MQMRNGSTSSPQVREQTTRRSFYKGSTFFFDADGKMLTGWVTADGDDVVNEENDIKVGTTYFCDETGARVESGWVYTTEPATADDDADADEYWYYLKSSGKVATGKQSNVKGQGFVFGNKDDNRGQMLTGWVGGKYDATDKSYTYEEIGGEDSQVQLSDYRDNDVVYYCMYDEDKADGHIQKKISGERSGDRKTHMMKTRMMISTGTGLKKDGEVYIRIQLI